MSTQEAMPIIEDPGRAMTRGEIRTRRRAQKRATKNDKIAQSKVNANVIHKIGTDKKGAYNTKAMTRQRRQINQARRDNH